MCTHPQGFVGFGPASAAGHGGRVVFGPAPRQHGSCDDVLRHQSRTSAAFPAREKLYSIVYSTYEKAIFGVENAVEKNWCIAPIQQLYNRQALRHGPVSIQHLYSTVECCIAIQLYSSSTVYTLYTTPLSVVSEARELRLAVSVPRHLPYCDDAHAPSVGRDDEGIGHLLPLKAHARAPVPSRRRARRLLQEPLDVHAPLAVPPYDHPPDAIMIEHDLLTCSTRGPGVIVTGGLACG